MKIPLFDFVDKTLELYQMKMPSYQYVEGQLKKFFEDLLKSDANGFVSLQTRIKQPDSLREKLMRNKFYIRYASSEEALDNLHDLIGITMQCRFIRNEAQLYEKMFSWFDASGSGFSQCRTNPDIYLNLHMPQPQTQRNGFTIYRIDGFYQFNGHKINYELQIKSLVHAFWSEIEHEVVYKNPDFVMYDEFNKNMLGAIRDNLDVVDRQLEIMYNEISYESSQAEIGMDEQGFKRFVSRSINELVNRKMKESVGFTTDFKKCSAMIAQYIYVRDFVNGDHNEERMIDYFQKLNYLTDAKIDFTETIELEKPYEGKDSFSRIFGDYFMSVMNTDFQWHVFFVMLFEIQPGSNLEDFSGFIDVLHLLLIQPGWYRKKFNTHEDHGKKARELLERDLAEALTDINRIEIVHEDHLYDCMTIFRGFVENADHNCPDSSSFEENYPKMAKELSHRIHMAFES